MRWVLALIITLLIPPAAEAAGNRLVVQDLRGDRVDAASLDYLSAQLRSESLRWISAGWLMMARPSADLRTSGADQGITGVVSWSGRVLTMRLQRVDARSGAVLSNATAKGRNLSALVEALAPACRQLLAPPDRDRAVGPDFEFTHLPPLPVTLEPRELDPLDIAVLGTLDLVALEDLDRVAQFDRGNAPPSRKEGRWLDLGARRPQFATLATARAEEWRVYREELDRSADLRRSRRSPRDRDWERLRRLLRISVISSEDKVVWCRRFLEAYGEGPPDNPYTQELRRLLLASNPYLDFDEDDPYEVIDGP